ncbi:MAG: rod shape-determining protein MreD [Treponema sp.]|jgi:rod shape-determining protein MreD|nr:rod shape-determining protein MreD [Treponema sp.]
MIKTIIWTVIFSIAAAVLQSTLLRYITLYRAVPDIALSIVVYSAYVDGTMTGQVAGFCSGIILDLISAAPLGLNALVRTLVGALTGLLKGTFFLNFFLPILLCAAATLVKAACLFALHLLLGDAVPAYSLMEPTLWAELSLNAISAPFVFALLKRFKPLRRERSRN